jgi:predicted Zn-dependent peptidase
MIQRLALGPTLGRHTLGTPETLANITPDSIRGHWKKLYSAGRLQVAAAGPVDADALIRRLEERFDGFGERTRTSRGNAPVEFRAQREHRHKELEQEYINLALPGAARESPDFAVEQVLIGILAGGMSGRLFTEVREKQGLVYSVSAWHEQPRGKGIIHLSASTTPERCPRTYETLLRELQRLSEDLTESETLRARNSLLAHHQTEDDLTRARAGGLSDDLFYFGRPIGTPAKMEAIRAVTMAQVEAYVRRLPRDQVCVATLGPRDLD